MLTNSIGVRLALIPAGEFLMGSSPDGRPRTTRSRGTPSGSPGRSTWATEVTGASSAASSTAAGYRTEAERDGKGGRGWNERTRSSSRPEVHLAEPGFAQTTSTRWST